MEVLLNNPIIQNGLMMGITALGSSYITVQKLKVEITYLQKMLKSADDKADKAHSRIDELHKNN